MSLASQTAHLVDAQLAAAELYAPVVSTMRKRASLRIILS